MRTPNPALLLVAAFAQTTFGAVVRFEILNHHAPRYFPASNATASASTTPSEISTPTYQQTPTEIESPISIDNEPHQSPTTSSKTSNERLSIADSHDSIGPSPSIFISSSIPISSPTPQITSETTSETVLKTISETNSQATQPESSLSDTSSLNLVSVSKSDPGFDSTTSSPFNPQTDGEFRRPRPQEDTSSSSEPQFTIQGGPTFIPEPQLTDQPGPTFHPDPRLSTQTESADSTFQIDSDTSGQVGPTFTLYPDPDPSEQAGPTFHPDPSPDRPNNSPTYICPDSVDPYECGPRPSTTFMGNQTGGYWPSNYTTPPEPPLTPCTPLTDGETATEYSIIYTSTVTFYGNSSDYTPPYETIETPNYCGTTVGSTGPPEPESSNLHRTFSTRSIDSHVSATPCGESCGFSAPGYEKPSTGYKGGTTASSVRPTVTFVTTDKNPSVVFPSQSPPRYSRAGDGAAGNRVPGEHKTVPSDEQSGGQGGGQNRGQNGGQGNGQGNGQNIDPQGVDAPQPTYIVTARGDEVIINDQTYSGLQPGQSSTVTVGDGVFTILPSAVVGEGTTIEKPQPAGTGGGAIPPQTTMAGDVPVVVSGSQVVVGSSTFTIPPAGTTAIVNNQPVSIGAGTVIVNGQTLTFQTPDSQQTDVIVQGGEMVTAAGQSIYVFHQTTLTYGPGIAVTTEVVDDDTITIGPSGITVHDKTLGGPSAPTSNTTYEIVGGATITKLSPSYIIIDGTTFTVGPGATSTTKVIGGETVTIGPSGVSIESMTLTYPFGPSKVATIKPSVTKARNLPSQTGGSDEGSGDNDETEDDDSAGAYLRPDIMGGTFGICIAIGVWVLI